MVPVQSSPSKEYTGKSAPEGRLNKLDTGAGHRRVVD